MENTVEYPIIKNKVDDSLENVSATLSLVDAGNVSFGTLYHDFSHEIVALLVNGIEMKEAQKFQESLTKLEKAGFVSKEKLAKFEKETAVKKGVAACVAYAVLDVAPHLFHLAAGKSDLHQFQIFYVSWLAYINKVDNDRIRQNVLKYFLPNKVKDYEAIFSRYSAEDIKSVDLPTLKGHNFIKFNNYEKEQMKLFAAQLLRACDLQEAGVRGRAEDFLDVYCRLSAPDIDRVMDSVSSQGEFLSDFIIYNAVTAEDVFKDLFGAVKKGRTYAVYNIDNDPYRKIRQQKVHLLDSKIKLATDKLTEVCPRFKPLEAFVDMASEIWLGCVDAPSGAMAMKVGEISKQMKQEIKDAGKYYNKQGR